jgi:hypothetical protein
MATQIILGKGTTITMSTTSGGTYTALNQVVSLSCPEIEREMIDQDHLGAKLKKKRPGKMEAPKATMRLWYDPTDTGHIDLKLAADGTSTQWSATLRWFKILLLDPDAGTTKATCSFPAWVGNIGGIEVESGSNVPATVELTLDDFPVWS